MNLENIQKIVNFGYPNWKHLLYIKLATDKSAIETILNVLAIERLDKDKLILDLNFQLSRAHLAIRTPIINKDNFIDKAIIDFYRQGRIGHCMANMDVIDPPTTTT